MAEEIVEETTENSEVTPEEVPTEEQSEEQTEEKPIVDDSKFKDLEDKNRQLFERAKKAEADAKAFKAELEKSKKNSQPDKSLDVEDYIDISTSLEGLDQREKERLAREHKLTGRPLSEIRKDEDFILWQQAYKAKVEKEKALNPSTRQTLQEKPKSFTEQLLSSSLEEKEKLLASKGLWRDPRAHAQKEKINLGRG